MNQRKKTGRTASVPPQAAERRKSSSMEYKQATSTAEQQDSDARRFFERIASDKQASVNFLKAAGILDNRGTLAKQFKN